MKLKIPYAQFMKNCLRCNAVILQEDAEHCKWGTNCPNKCGMLYNTVEEWWLGKEKHKMRNSAVFNSIEYDLQIIWSFTKSLMSKECFLLIITPSPVEAIKIPWLRLDGQFVLIDELFICRSSEGQLTYNLNTKEIKLNKNITSTENINLLK